jgi:hypothetical protein
MVSLAVRSSAVSMRPEGLDGKGHLTQALIIRFPRGPETMRLYQGFDTLFPRQSKFKFDPHLSLLYHNLTADQTGSLLREIALDMQEMVFDELWAVAIPEKLVAPDNLHGWQTLLTCRLASARYLDTIDSSTGHVKA